jgi:hypothetical protein
MYSSAIHFQGVIALAFVRQTKHSFLEKISSDHSLGMQSAIMSTQFSIDPQAQNPFPRDDVACLSVRACVACGVCVMVWPYVREAVQISIVCTWHPL